MGLLDGLARSVLKQAAKTAVSTAINNAVNGNNNDQQAAPPKADVQRKVEYYAFDNNDKEYHAEATFMLSGDFVESKTSAGEIDAVYVYDPSCNDEFIPLSLSDNCPYLMVTGDIDEVYVAVTDFAEGKDINGAIYVQPQQDGKALFKAQIIYYKKWIMTYYGFRQQYGGHPWGLCMVYDTKIKGSALENRLISDLDKAMASLEERLLSE